MTKLIQVVLIGIFISLAGCARTIDMIADGAERFRPASTAVLDVVETTTAIKNIRQSYLDAREAVREQRGIFSDADWQVLQRGDETLTEFADELRQLKQQQGVSEIVLTSAELLALILPVRDAINAMIIVMDAHVDQFDPAGKYLYREATRNFYQIDGKLNRIVSNADAAARVEMIKDLLRITSRLIGVAQLALDR